MKMRVFAPAMLAVALGGCGSIGAIGVPTSNRGEPEPVDPVAVSPVQSSNLPPVAGAQPPNNSGIVGTGQTPGAPGTTAALNTPPAQSGSLGRTDLLGGWTITSSGDSCQLFMTLTSWTGGYRASTRGCSSETLKSISAWNLSGTQVVLAGSGGTAVATLVPSGNSRFDGQTGQGMPVSFYR